MTQLTNVIFFHQNCNDGTMAAAIAHELLLKDSSVSFGINYDANDIEPEKYVDYLKEKTEKSNIPDLIHPAVRIWFVDFCPKPKQVETLVYAGFNVVIIDHHKSAYEAMVEHGYLLVPATEKGDTFKNYLLHDSRKLNKVGYVEGRLTCAENNPNNGLLRYWYSDTDSGALMTYRILKVVDHNDPEDMEASIPDFIRWVSDRDTWQFKFSESKPFAAGMQRYRNVRPNMLMELLTHDKVAEIVSVGQALTEANDAYVEKQLKNQIRTVMISDDLCTPIQLVGIDPETGEELDPVDAQIALYNNTHLPSELCDAYWTKQSDIHIMASYTVIDESRVIYSVRSRKGYNSVWLAKYFGGGGHDNANGFTTDLQTLCKFLTEDVIMIDQSDARARVKLLNNTMSGAFASKSATFIDPKTLVKHPRVI